MRRTIIACSLILSFAITTAAMTTTAMAQEGSRHPRLVYVAEKEATTSSYWPSWKMPNLWPTGLGTRIASGTRSSWSTVKTGTSRAWYATKYTVAPWSKPAAPSLTGSRGVTSSKPKTQPASKPKSKEANASWWPKLDFWNSEEKEQELKNVGDWQLQSSPAAGFDDE